MRYCMDDLLHLGKVVVIKESQIKRRRYYLIPVGFIQVTDFWLEPGSSILKHYIERFSIQTWLNYSETSYREGLKRNKMILLLTIFDLVWTREIRYLMLPGSNLKESFTIFGQVRNAHIIRYKSPSVLHLFLSILKRSTSSKFTMNFTCGYILKYWGTFEHERELEWVKYVCIYVISKFLGVFLLYGTSNICRFIEIYMYTTNHLILTPVLFSTFTGIHIKKPYKML